MLVIWYVQVVFVLLGYSMHRIQIHDAGCYCVVAIVLLHAQCQQNVHHSTLPKSLLGWHRIAYVGEVKVRCLRPIDYEYKYIHVWWSTRMFMIMIITTLMNILALGMRTPGDSPGHLQPRPGHAAERRGAAASCGDNSCGVYTYIYIYM